MRRLPMNLVAFYNNRKEKELDNLITRVTARFDEKKRKGLRPVFSAIKREPIIL